MVATAFSQQFQPGTQYLYNGYSLSPTLAGITGYSEVFLDYRTCMTKIDGHPQTFNVNGYGNIKDGSMWLGGSVLSDKTGVLSTLKADLSYTYKLQVENNQYLYFGIWTSFYQASVNIGDGVGIDVNDPLLLNSSDKANSSTLNAGFGINYNWYNLNVGISMPSMFGRNTDYSDQTEFKYYVQREFRIHASYLFEFSKDFQLKTMGVVYKTADEPGSFDLSAMAIIQNRYWGALMYRSGGAVDISVGAHITKGFVFGYSYEAGLGNIYQGSGGAHEITLGFRFGFFDGDNFFDNSDSKNSSKSKRTKRNSYSGLPEVNDYKYRRR